MRSSFTAEMPSIELTDESIDEYIARMDRGEQSPAHAQPAPESAHATDIEPAVEVTKKEPPHTIEAKVEGTPLGIVGRITATSLTSLSQVGNDTKIEYEIDAAITGKLGSLGQPVLKSKAKEMEKQFAGRLREKFAQAPSETGS